MEAQEIIDAFRSELDEIERQGTSTLQTSALRSYLLTLEKGASLSKEQRSQQHEGYLVHYAALNTTSLAMLTAVLEAGKTALQALLVINGGAVVALLGVISNLAGKPEGNTLARYLAVPLLLFGIAVLLGALGFACRYFSQASYAEAKSDVSKWEKRGKVFRNFAIASAGGGYILFGIAIYLSYEAVRLSF